MKLSLIKASERYREQITDMLDEWNSTGEKIIPYAIRRLDYHDFAYYCDHLEVKEATDGLVPDSTFFCLDEERNMVVGAVNIRHCLNEALRYNGGHIGDGVRPSERRKGIATKMIALALEECKKLGLEKVLMVCAKENIASAKSIRNNGGVLENEIFVDGVIEQRYWISLDSSEAEQGKGEAAMITEESCGAVVFTRERGQLQYVIVRSKEGVFGFPKGHREGAETEKETALREIAEETGLQVTLVEGFRTEDSHTFCHKGETRKKHIVYFLAQFSGQQPVAQEAELQGVHLMTLSQALEAFQFESSKRILTQAHTFLERLGVVEDRG